MKLTIKQLHGGGIYQSPTLENFDYIVERGFFGTQDDIKDPGYNDEYEDEWI